MVACRKPSAWNIGAGSEVTSLALNGTCDRIPPIGANVGGVLRFAPFGVPVVPLVRMMIDECLLALGAGDLLCCGDQVGQRLVGAARVVAVRGEGQGAQLAQRRLGFADVLGVLVVVNDQLGALALGDLFDLRAGERAVEQDDAGPDPRATELRNGEPAVVARQDGHPVAAAHTLGQQAVRDRVGGLVEFLVGQWALVVDDRRTIRACVWR